MPPTGGTIEFDGENIFGQPAFAIVRRRLALSPEGWRLFVQQTVEQNLLLGATVLADRARLPELLDRVFVLFPRLAERRRQRAGTLSGGERQMLATGRALMSDPRLLLLDEPSLGLAPAVVESLYETLVRLRAGGLTMLSGRAVGRARPWRFRGPCLRAADRPHRAGRARPPSWPRTRTCSGSISGLETGAGVD